MRCAWDYGFGFVFVKDSSAKFPFSSFFPANHWHAYVPVKVPPNLWISYTDISGPPDFKYTESPSLKSAFLSVEELLITNFLIKRENMALTDKQEMFCREYLIDLNATQAAIRAGYSAKTANRTASENMSKPDIQSRIAELKSQRNDLVGINATYVLNRLIEIDQMDVVDILLQNGELKPIKDWPKVWRTTLSGIDVVEVASGDNIALLKKIKWPDKVKNLELLGKHVSVQAFKDQAAHELTGIETSPMSTLFGK